MQSLLEDLQLLIRRATAGGGSQAVARHKERGKLLPRERIAALLDQGAPFLELSQLAGHDLYGEQVCQRMLLLGSSALAPA